MDNLLQGHTNEGEPIIKIAGVRKRYRLGQIGSGTLQGDIKEWRERRQLQREGKLDGSIRMGDDFYALDGIDLTVYKGEALGIIGKNGAGKSTLLKLLSRITAPTEGEIDL